MKSYLPLALLALLAGQAHADADYDVRGAVGGRRFEGRVTLANDVDGMQVGLEVRYEDGARATWSGRGAWSGDVVTASVLPTRGVAGLIGGAAPTAAETLTHELQDRGQRWRVRLGALEGAGQVAQERIPTTSTRGAAGSKEVERWRRVEGVPFVQGEGDPGEVHESDPAQGRLGDCWLIAGLMAVAHAQPDRIKEMIQPGVLSGEWTVRLRARRYLIRRKQVDVAVDGKVPVDQFGQPVFARLGDTETRGDTVVHELWPALIERAYAQERGGYGKIEGGFSTNLFGLCGLDGDLRWTKLMTVAAIDRLMGEALAKKEPLCVGFPPCLGELGKSLGLVPNHAYMVVRAEDGGYRLLNPWQSDHPSRAITAAELRDLGVGIFVGRER